MNGLEVQVGNAFAKGPRSRRGLRLNLVDLDLVGLDLVVLDQRLARLAPSSRARVHEHRAADGSGDADGCRKYAPRG